MDKSMKVMVGYDGSPYADDAINNLAFAGLPPNGEILIVDVTDISKTAIANSHELGVLGKFVSPQLLEETVALTQKETAQALNEAKKLATRGVRLVRSTLPEWSVTSQTLVGNPTEELLQTAKVWKPDLIVVGSHGRGAIGRFFLGSVSRKIAEGAICSVRVTKHSFEKDESALNRIIIGASSLPGAEYLVEVVGKRVWTTNTEVRLVKVDDGISAGRVSAFYPYTDSIFEQLADKLRNIGLKVSVDIQRGNLKSILLEEAENWAVDSIFVMAGKTVEDFKLSETANGLITDARCSVEIVRQFY